jgi:sulfide dehydrogenase [flavocytochrome c] flavoprotein subunit
VDRRTFLQASAALGLSMSALPAWSMRGAKVVVIGGGYGGATAAKYIRLLSEGKIDVTIVEPNKEFISCPMSNLVIGGSRQLADISRPYSTLTKNHGIRIVQDTVTAIDSTARTVKLAGGNSLSYDKLVVSPGVELDFNSVEGLAEAKAAGKILQ